MKKLKEVMSENVQCMRPEMTLREIAFKMKELDVGSIPICENDRLVGMVTDRDIVIKTLSRGLDLQTARARDVMSAPVVYCFEDQDVSEASRLMEVKQIRRLLVLNRDKKLVGIFSIGDLSARAGTDELVGETLSKIVEATNHAVA